MCNSGIVPRLPQRIAVGSVIASLLSSSLRSITSIFPDVEGACKALNSARSSLISLRISSKGLDIKKILSRFSVLIASTTQNYYEVKAALGAPGAVFYVSLSNLRRMVWLSGFWIISL
jgi:hypothetical protein